MNMGVQQVWGTIRLEWWSFLIAVGLPPLVLGYVSIFVASYAVLRSWQVSIVWAVIGALAFDLMSTHHERMNHMTYVW